MGANHVERAQLYDLSRRTSLEKFSFVFNGKKLVSYELYFSVPRLSLFKKGSIQKKLNFASP